MIVFFRMISRRLLAFLRKTQRPSFGSQDRKD